MNGNKNASTAPMKTKQPGNVDNIGWESRNINTQHFQVPFANRGRLLLRSPGPSHLGLVFVLMFRPFIPQLVMSTDLFSFRTFLGTSILLKSTP